MAPPLANEGPRRPYPLIRKQLVILGTVASTVSLIRSRSLDHDFPYIYSMVQSFSTSKSDDQNSAIYAGIMVSVFTLGEFIMATQWAKISDRIGRKPTLLVGSIGTIFSALLFGFSKSLSWAIVARTAAGLLNPNLGVVQTFVGELVPKEDQAKGFSVVPFFRSLGTIIGPVLGGYLAEPVQRYSSLFAKGTIWDRYPYLLPNVVVVVFLSSSCIAGYFYLEEVHPKYRGEIVVWRNLANALIRIFGVGASNNYLTGSGYSVVGREERTIELAQTPSATDRIEEVSTDQAPSAFTRQVMLQILSSAILGFLKIAILALVPIFLATPSEPINSSAVAVDSKTSILNIKGGFGLNTTSTSNVLLSQAIVTIISQALAIPPIISKLGPLQSYRAVLIALLLIFVLMPFAASISSWAGVPAILILLWVYSLGMGLATTSGAILITNTAPSPMYLARINSASASLGCLARTLGPALSGPLFRLGLQIGFTGLPFWSLGVVSGVGVLVSFFLRGHA